jgi:hypothetical protein
MNCPHCRAENPRTCGVCGETLCCAKGVSRCFTRHPLPPTRPRLVAEIVETAATEARALARIEHVDAFLGSLGWPELCPACGEPPVQLRSRGRDGGRRPCLAGHAERPGEFTEVAEAVALRQFGDENVVSA